MQAHRTGALVLLGAALVLLCTGIPQGHGGILFRNVVQAAPRCPPAAVSRGDALAQLLAAKRSESVAPSHAPPNASSSALLVLNDTNVWRIRGHAPDCDRVTVGHCARPGEAPARGTLTWHWLMSAGVPLDPQRLRCDSANGDAAFAVTSKSRKTAVQGKHARRLFYRLQNVCMSPRHGLSAYWPERDRDDVFRMNDLVDEKRTTLRGILAVRRRATAPSCVVNRTVVLHPLLLQSDNLGHVMYRVAATERLASRLDAVADSRSDPAIVAYLATTHAKASVGLGHKYGVFSPASQRPWFALFAPDEDEASVGATSGDHSVCFANVVVGWDAVEMYTGRKPQDAQRQRRVTMPALAALRQELLRCYAPPSAAQAPDAPRVWTLVDRQQRRLTDIEAAATEVSRLLGPSWRVRIADFAAMTPLEQVQLARRSTVLMGPHGTALQWALVMQPDAAIVEVQYPGYSCTNVGVNPPSRRHCEYGAAALVAGVSHVVWRDAGDGVTGCDGSRQRCDVALNVSAITRIVAAATCAVRVGVAAAGDACPL